MSQMVTNNLSYKKSHMINLNIFGPVGVKLTSLAPITNCSKSNFKPSSKMLNFKTMHYSLENTRFLDLLVKLWQPSNANISIFDLPLSFNIILLFVQNQHNALEFQMYANGRERKN